jgi:putative zinc finger/helix-turn-helix YgiT family protein
MKCLKCSNDQFIDENIRFTPIIKDEEIEVVVPCMTCTKCHSPLMTTEQMNTLRKAAADKYKENHGLLTSSQIVAYREELEMSQIAFSRYINVGEASIKRWETYYIQDASQDELIRLKCNSALAEMNYLTVVSKQNEPNLFNGNRKFNFQIMKNVILYLTSHIKTSKLFLNKVLFYTDFLHFKEYQTSLTGICYQPLKYGPCPERYDAIYNTLISKNFLHEDTNHIFQPLCKPDLSVFDDREKKTLEQIISYCKKLGIQKLYHLSHKEKGYTETDECSLINYDFAQDLLLPE